jgi:ABC-type glutathione transport system ATPase component
MTESVLEARNLEVTFRGRGNQTARAVDGVDLSLGRGEIVAFVGESGCGKTTLSRAHCSDSSGLRAARSSSTGSRWSTRAGALKKHRRSAQLVLQDPDRGTQSAQVGVRGCRRGASRAPFRRR